MHKKIRGSALITSLFIVTIIAIVVTSMTEKLRIDIHHAKITITNDKLYLASQAVTYWAIEQIQESQKPFIALDNLGKVLSFPKEYSNIYPGIITSGEIYDLQARFNLNNLTDETYKPVFYELIGKINPQIKKQTRMKIVEATANWINGSPKKQTQRDEWLDNYLQQKPPYLPGYQKMQSISELRTVLGVNAKIYNSLEKYISAIPEITPININTTSSYLLNSLSQNPKQKIIEKILQLRKNKAIENISTITPLIEEIKITANKLTINSNYYLIVSRTKNNDLNFTNYITIKTIPNKDKSIRIQILKESFNTE